MIDKYLTKKNIKIALVALLVLEMLLILAGNLIRNSQLLDDDMSMIFVHVMEMAKNHTFVIPGWNFINSMEIDGPAIFAMPLYMITKNIYVSFAIAIFILMLLWVWTVLRIFRYEKEEHALLALILIFIPYGLGLLDYFNMLFFNGSYYIIRIILPLMLISMLVALEHKSSIKIKEEIVYSIIYFILLFTTTFSSGIYSAATGIFPVLAYMFIRSFVIRKAFSKEHWIYVIASVVAIVAGFVGTRAVGVSLYGNGMMLCNIYDLPDNITAMILGIFELFKGVGYEDVTILSAQGIHKVLRVLFTLFLLSTFFISVYRWIKGKLDFISQILISIFIWNCFVLSLTKATNYLGTSEYRYHLIGVIPLLIVFARMLYDDLPRVLDRRVAVAFITVMLAYLNISSFGIFYTAKNPNTDLEDLCSYLETVDSDNIYFLNDIYKAEICQLIDETDSEYLNVDFDGNVVVRDYYDFYNHQQIDTNNTVLIVNTDIWEIVEDNGAWIIGENRFEYGGEFEKINNFGFFDIYKSKL